MGARIVLGVGILALLASGCEGSAVGSASSADSSSGSSASVAPPADAAADAVGPDMSFAKPLSPRLAAQLAQSVESIKALAPGLVAPYGGGRMEVVDDTFVLVAGERRAPLDDAVNTVHAATQALWHGLMYHRPTRAAVVWVFHSRANYSRFVEKYGSKANVADLSFYVPDSPNFPGKSEVYFCEESQGIRGIAHEVAHHLLTRGDFPRAPRFIAEGVPALLEAADPQPDGDLRVKAHFRLVTVRHALSDPRYAHWCTVEALFDRSEENFWSAATESLAYAISREFLRFLEVRKHALVPFYRTYREGFLNDRQGRDALSEATGVKWPYELTDEFQSWIRSADAEQDEP